MFAVEWSDEKVACRQVGGATNAGGCARVVRGREVQGVVGDTWHGDKAEWQAK